MQAQATMSNVLKSASQADPNPSEKNEKNPPDDLSKHEKDALLSILHILDKNNIGLSKSKISKIGTFLIEVSMCETDDKREERLFEMEYITKDWKAIQMDKIYQAKMATNCTDRADYDEEEDEHEHRNYGEDDDDNSLAGFNDKCGEEYGAGNIHSKEDGSISIVQQEGDEEDSFVEGNGQITLIVDVEISEDNYINSDDELDNELINWEPAKEIRTNIYAM
jgi:hypothetical protein